MAAEDILCPQWRIICRASGERSGSTTGAHYDFDDGGAAVALAGRPAGWLAASERVVADNDLNINRRGVVFVQGFEGRDLDRLERMVAETSRAVYLAMLEREG